MVCVSCRPSRIQHQLPDEHRGDSILRVHGVRRFNGDVLDRQRPLGVDGHNAHRNPSGTNLPILADNFSANFTYMVAPDQTIHIENGPLTHTRISGFQCRPSTNVNTGIKIEGHVSQD